VAGAFGASLSALAWMACSGDIDVATSTDAGGPLGEMTEAGGGSGGDGSSESSGGSGSGSSSGSDAGASGSSSGSDAGDEPPPSQIGLCGESIAPIDVTQTTVVNLGTYYVEWDRFAVTRDYVVGYAEPGPPGGNALMRTPVSGANFFGAIVADTFGSPETIRPVVDGDNAYFLLGGSLRRIPLCTNPPQGVMVGGDLSVPAVPDDGRQVADFVLANGSLFWTEPSTPGDAGTLGARILTVAVSGGTPEVLASPASDPASLVATAAGAYWTEQGDIHGVTLDGTSSLLVAGDGATSLAATSTAIFWLNGTNQIKTLSLSGGSATLVGTLSDALTSGIATDGNRVYVAGRRGLHRVEVATGVDDFVAPPFTVDPGVQSYAGYPTPMVTATPVLAGLSVYYFAVQTCGTNEIAKLGGCTFPMVRTPR
jgi:hypothetical protein